MSAGRSLQDALAEALPVYWEGRAETFANVGNDHSDEIARACLNAAAFHRVYGLELTDDDIAAVLRTATYSTDDELATAVGSYDSWSTALS